MPVPRSVHWRGKRNPKICLSSTEKRHYEATLDDGCALNEVYTRRRTSSDKRPNTSA